MPRGSRWPRVWRRPSPGASCASYVPLCPAEWNAEVTTDRGRKQGFDDYSLSAVAEILVVAAWRGSALALVLRSNFGRAVRSVGRGGHAQEADLPDLHARIERDGQVGHIRQLQG